MSAPRYEIHTAGGIQHRSDMQGFPQQFVAAADFDRCEADRDYWRDKYAAAEARLVQLALAWRASDQQRS